MLRGVQNFSLSVVIVFLSPPPHNSCDTRGRRSNFWNITLTYCLGFPYWFAQWLTQTPKYLLSPPFSLLCLVREGGKMLHFHMNVYSNRSNKPNYLFSFLLQPCNRFKPSLFCCFRPLYPSMVYEAEKFLAPKGPEVNHTRDFAFQDREREGKWNKINMQITCFESRNSFPAPQNERERWEKGLTEGCQLLSCKRTTTTNNNNTAAPTIWWSNLNNRRKAKIFCSKRLGGQNIPWAAFSGL